MRNASKDTMIGSTMIKKDTMIFPLLYSMTVDEKTWEDPMEFRPERHLNKDKVLLGLSQRKTFLKILLRKTFF